MKMEYCEGKIQRQREERRKSEQRRKRELRGKRDERESEEKGSGRGKKGGGRYLDRGRKGRVKMPSFRCMLQWD